MDSRQPNDAVACHGPFAAVTRPASDPPFSGTSFIDPNSRPDVDQSFRSPTPGIWSCAEAMFDTQTVEQFNPAEDAHVFVTIRHPRSHVEVRR